MVKSFFGGEEGGEVSSFEEGGRGSSFLGGGEEESGVLGVGEGLLKWFCLEVIFLLRGGLLREALSLVESTLIFLS